MGTQIIPGTNRETNNPLLLKADYGKPQRRGFVLPPDTFTYGKTTQGETYGACDTMSWHPNTKLKPLHLKEKKPERDFISMNKEATRSGLVTAQEHFQYRATHEKKLASIANKEVKCKSAKEVPANMVHGVPTKPSTPVFDLLEHKYQDTWLEELQTSDLNTTDKEKEGNRVHKKGYGETRASRLRRYSPPVDAAPLWQMPKFQKKALPALQTFRNENVRAKAFRHHSTDCTSRTGVFGHGNYEPAKS